MGYNGQLEIVSILNKERAELEKLKAMKSNAATLSLERDYLLRAIKKEEYIRGLSDSLLLIQKEI